MLNSLTLRILRRLLRDYARAYAPRYALSFVLMGIVAGCTALSAWIMKDVVNKIFVDQDQAALVWVPATVAAIFIIKGVTAYLQEVWLTRTGNRLVAEAQRRLFNHLLKMDVGFFQKFPSGDLIMQMTQTTRAVRDMVNLVALGFGRDLMTLIGLVIVMVSQDPMLAAICLVAGPLAAIALRYLAIRVQKIAQGELFSIATIIGAMRETAQGIRIVKSFQLEDQQRRRMDDGIKAVERISNNILGIQAGVNPLIETLGGLAVAAAIVYAGWRNQSFGDTPGQFFAFMTALLLAADPGRRLSKLQLQLSTSAIAVNLMYEMLDKPAAEAEAGHRPDLEVRDGEVRFDEVTFAYDPDAPVLKGLTFCAPAGKTTALVGLSGSGKTTTFNLLQRLWSPGLGGIHIDGQSIMDVSLGSLRRHIALVSQDVFLFEGTIQENIAAGREGATKEEVLAAARMAHADEFIRTLAQGYDTPVGELGMQLSGGQRQRISLARAFLKNAPIILLDEPTSALDSEAEQAIQDALARLTRGRTTIVIAHRLATVANADLIHVLDQGQVVESGRHRELIARGGIYARLYHLQFANAVQEEASAPPLRSVGA